MSYPSGGRGGPDYALCRYGNSRLSFRGPRKPCVGDFVACIGGTETYGRFLHDPWPDLLQRRTGVPCVNFGVQNAGIDAGLNDAAVLDICGGARLTVIEVLGAQNMSNRFYTVHPRRNDRFVRASTLLTALYPDVDFTDHAFVRGMLTALHARDPERFRLVVTELQTAWVARMKLLLTQLRGPVFLLWCADAAPPAAIDCATAAVLEGDPLFVTAPMLEALGARVAGRVTYVRSAAARAAGTEGMAFSDFDRVAAEAMLGARAHDEIAEALAAAVTGFLRVA
ncbi:DUF6473 family protein [Roseivivax isoporae]|uniref:DUF6473 domain-containing protein n=1 Tax=Roseivivax isoporae LMG 25204 TaxID=1449351 RepID=X7FDN7_9RHOB|nr:DUF6473 family protein [Roseivivax isoporae]ETX30883.1 hypothetical protein RISW2_00465 [Roseivivax isoporae LMG 25204]